MRHFTDERCKEIMIELGMKDSQSLYIALNQVANEVEQSVMNDMYDKISYMAKVLRSLSMRISKLELKEYV